MAVARGLAMHLSRIGQLPSTSPSGSDLSCSAAAAAPCCLATSSNLCILSSLFGGIPIRSRNVSAARKNLAVGAALSARASQEASTSTLLVQEVEFTWKGQGSEVLLTGDFLNWETQLPLEKRTTGDFCLKQKLALGRYSYKFIVDGAWKHSPDSPTVSDGTGGFNNEVVVTDPTTTNGVKDFENATKAQVLQPSNSVKTLATPKPAKESKSDVAVGTPKASTEPKPAKEKKSDVAVGNPKASTEPKPAEESKSDVAVGNPKASTEPNPAKESKSDVAVGNPKASTEPRPKAAPKKVVPQSLAEIMSNNVIPLLRSALSKEAGITDLDVTFEDNQLKTSFAKGDIPYCHWVFFPDGILEGFRGSSLTSHRAPPSTIEPFLIDEKKITPELIVFWVKKRLFASKILSMN